MHQLSQQQYLEWLTQFQVLVSGKRGPRLLATTDNCLIKLFPARKWWSSNRLFPYAKRFVDNAERLAILGVSSVKVEEYGKIQGTMTYYVKYQKLPGNDIRHLLQTGTLIELLAQVAIFISCLHHQGIFFRGIHLGNMILQPDSKIALIDIAPMKFKSNTLAVGYRRRNLQHLLSNVEDRPWFMKFGIENFLQNYLKHANLTITQQHQLQKGLY